MRVRDLDHFGPDGDLRYLLNTKLNYPEFIIYSSPDWYDELIKHLRICGWSRHVPLLNDCLKGWRNSQPWHCKYNKTVLQVEEATVYGESNSGQVACEIYRVFDGHRTFIVF